MPLDMETAGDEVLAQQAQAGSMAHFEELVHRYESRIHRYLAARTGSRHEAEDLTQQVFVRAWRNLHRYRLAQPFAPWLYTLARHAGIGHFRARASRPATGAANDDESVVDETPRDLLARREAGEGLWALARASLPERQFTALWLMYAEDMSVKEIARSMGLFQPHVKVLLHRARRAMRIALAGEAGELRVLPARCRQKGVSS